MSPYEHQPSLPNYEDPRLCLVLYLQHSDLANESVIIMIFTSHPITKPIDQIYTFIALLLTGVHLS